MLNHLHVPLKLTLWAFKAIEKMKSPHEAVRSFIKFSQKQVAQERICSLLQTFALCFPDRVLLQDT